MKKFKLSILILTVTMIFCSCNQRLISDDSSDSTSTIISDSENSVIINKQVVFGGEELNRLEENGIIPDLKLFGIDSADFTYAGEYLQRVGIGDEWLDKPGSYLYLHWFNYTNKEGDAIAIDKAGRLRRYYVDIRQTRIEIPKESIVSEDVLSDKAVQLCEQYLANWGNFKKYNALPPVIEDDQFLTFDYVENIADNVDNYLTVSFFSDGRIYSLCSDYCDIATSFSCEKFDKFAEDWFAKNLPERYRNLAKYEISSKSFEAVDDKIYGSYTVICEFSDGSQDCIGILFEEPKE